MRHLGLKIRMAVVGAILAAFYLVAITVAVVVFGQGILPIAIAGSPLLAGFQYKIGKWAALRSVGAEDLPETQYAQIHQFVEQVCDEKNMKKPPLKIASMGMPNASAVGRRGNGTIVISRELTQLLDRDELEGVVAHELVHVDNRDVITIQLGQDIVSMIATIVQYVVLFTGDNDLANFFLAIVVGQIVQFLMVIFVPAISRYREYIADADAERIIDFGDPLARALERIQQGNQQARKSARTAQRSHGRVRHDRCRDTNIDQQVSVLCISSPDRGFLQRVVSTHPPTEKRIKRLRSQTPGPRELLAIVFDVLLGIGLLAASRTVLQLPVFVGPARRRRGDYGTDNTIPDQWTWIVRGLGVTPLAVAAFITYQTYI